MLPLTNEMSNKDFWANIVLSAEATHEPFEQVNVVTLRSHFLDLVYEQAFDDLIEGGVWSEQMLIQRAREIIETSPPMVQEQVIFTPEGIITVVIDIPKINEDTVFDVMGMLADAIDRPRFDNKVILGVPRIYSVDVLVNFEQSQVNFACDR